MDKASHQDKTSGRLYWAKLFKATTWEEIKSLSNQYPELKEAKPPPRPCGLGFASQITGGYQTMYTDQDIRDELEALEKAERDRIWFNDYWHRMGKAEEYAIAKQINHMYYCQKKTNPPGKSRRFWMFLWKK